MKHIKGHTHMVSNIRIQTLCACLCGLLMSSTSAAWWATPAPQELYRNLMPMGQNFPGSPPADTERISRTLH
ncbi:MAG: hypothetical protein OXC07_12615, partial [Kistimonas sp.]|nr:hypothetical protein [Kistimonas sp.]